MSDKFFLNQTKLRQLKYATSDNDASVKIHYMGPRRVS